MATDIWYFGCVEEEGHYLFNTSLRHVHEDRLPADFPFPIGTLDCGLLNHRQRQIEGQAVLSHIGNWTVISFWDRSVDNRGNCNSNFIMRGKWDFSEALEYAKAAFPTIFARFTFEIVDANADRCEHGIVDGEFCELCNREYKRAAREE